MIAMLLLGACAQPPEGEAPAEVAEPADADGDGLLDEEETALGTDPTLVDSDGDTYWDPWELAEGTDPLDGESRIYEGYWPYSPDKDTLVDPGWEGGAEAGDAVPRFVAEDQFGEEVDLYDFSLGGRPVVIDLSHMWCYYCQQTALWLAGEPSEYYDEYYASMDFYTRIPQLVADGELGWVTILTEDYGGDPVITRDLRFWDDDFGVPGVPALEDPDGTVSDWFANEYVPTLFVVEEDMTVWERREDYTRVLDDLAERFAAEE